MECQRDAKGNRRYKNWWKNNNKRKLYKRHTSTGKIEKKLFPLSAGTGRKYGIEIIKKNQK